MNPDYYKKSYIFGVHLRWYNSKDRGITAWGGEGESDPLGSPFHTDHPSETYQKQYRRIGVESPA
jgi:hypothetical protein